MIKRIAIVGFGRIGRSTMKSAYDSGLFLPTAISDVKGPGTLVNLLMYDSNYGPWMPGRVSFQNAEKPWIDVGGNGVAFIDPVKEPGFRWDGLDVDVVIDCTGRATKREGAQAHLDRGAKRVIVSAPSKSKNDCDAVLLMGINHGSYDPAKHRIISMASCTTNALAPVVKVLLEKFGIRGGFFNTTHAYTNTQSLTDQPMADERDSWSATENMIPSSSGAAKALGLIWPGLEITGKAVRVPVRTVSIVELTVVTEKKINIDDVNEALEGASDNMFQGIMGVEKGEFASARFLHDSRSSIVDLRLTKVIESLSMLTLSIWYDNEWGYSCRLAELAKLVNDEEAG